jgi:hypothetical protein
LKFHILVLVKLPELVEKKEMFTLELKQKFPYIKVEAFDQRYKPDCILYNDADEKLYLEVYYSHKTSDEKIALGLPIIEIEVSSEKDINKIIDSQKIDQKTIKYKIYNDTSLLPKTTTFDIFTMQKLLNYHGKSKLNSI